MIRKNTQRLGDILDEVINTQHLDVKLYESRLISAFPEVAGKGLAAHVKNLYIQKNTLYMTVDSSVIRYEMQLMRTRLISQLNACIGHETIRDIVFR